jgi:hypothetical protein
MFSLRQAIMKKTEAKNFRLKISPMIDLIVLIISWKFQLKWMSFSEDMRYLKTGLFSKLLLESSGFCQRAISEEKHSSELKLSGYNKDYEI